MAAQNGLGKDRLTWMYTQMCRIREFEERVKRTFVEHPGIIRGHAHLGGRRRSQHRRRAGHTPRNRSGDAELSLPRLSTRAWHAGARVDG